MLCAHMRHRLLVRPYVCRMCIGIERVCSSVLYAGVQYRLYTAVEQAQQQRRVPVLRARSTDQPRMATLVPQRVHIRSPSTLGIGMSPGPALGEDCVIAWPATKYSGASRTAVVRRTGERGPGWLADKAVRTHANNKTAWTAPRVLSRLDRGRKFESTFTRPSDLLHMRGRLRIHSDRHFDLQFPGASTLSFIEFDAHSAMYCFFVYVFM